MGSGFWVVGREEGMGMDAVLSGLSWSWADDMVFRSRRISLAGHSQILRGCEGSG